MHTEDEIPILVLHVLEADIPQDPGIVDKDVDAAEALDGGLDDLLALDYVVVVGYGVATQLLDFFDDSIRGLWYGLATGC